MSEGGIRGVAERALGYALARYLRLVHRLNRFVVEPCDLSQCVAPHHPAIVAMWHGQHLMIPFARAANMTKACAMVSRHRDAGLQAAALKALGVEPIRGSGARGEKVREKGGARALIVLREKLAQGATIAMTADVPKIARVAGLGIVTLARISGRPILPVAVVTSRRIDFSSWDRASIGLPFGRGAMVIGEPIHVAERADAAAMEAARLKRFSTGSTASMRAPMPRSAASILPADLRPPSDDGTPL